MKRIIITGENSYIGNHIQSWLEKYSTEYDVKQIDVVTDKWINEDFASIDVIIHVAGIVHQPGITDWEIYKRVNVDLPLRIANKAKQSGVKQFIFMSTMAVYGIGKKLYKNVITEKTELEPKSMYGKSKYIAEKELMMLADDKFNVSIVRPPNVYGFMCKGNYISGFKMFVKRMPVIPVAYENVKQSMIYIDNLTEFIRLLIDYGQIGIFTPQDGKSISSVQLMRLIANSLGIKKRQSKLFGLAVCLFKHWKITKKIYGGVEYSDEISNCFDKKYQIVTIEKAIARTLNNE